MFEGVLAWFFCGVRAREVDILALFGLKMRGGVGGGRFAGGESAWIGEWRFAWMFPPSTLAV